MKKLIPFLLISILFICINLSNIHAQIGRVEKSMGKTEWKNPAWNTAHSFFEHAKLLVYPRKLTLYHEPNITSLKVITIKTIALALIILFLLWRRPKHLTFAFSILFFGIALTYSPVPVCHLVAERYLYFPSVALSIIVGWLCDT